MIMVVNMIDLTGLTKEQKEFAAENHHIIERFMKSRGLKHDKYYDVLASAYFRAVKRYCMRSDLWIYNFSAFALYAMKSVLYNRYRKQKRKKEIFTLSALIAGAQ
jgi:DNA-directed RNA polymerase specialized sigma24 family protein